MAQPSGALVSLPLDEAQARKIGLGGRWRTAMKKIISRRQRSDELADRLRTAIQTLLTHAAHQPEPWSQRDLARWSGLRWASWRRCRDGQVNAKRWLPKLEAALDRLKSK